jgi:cephalosporin-C deacetylase
MAQFDLTLEELEAYDPPRSEPEDFDRFWAATLAASREQAAAPRFEAVESPLRTIDALDVTFSGFMGQPIKGWFLAPHGATGPLPTVVEFIGYGGGRGVALDWLAWASTGYAHLVMDTRGQGASWRRGDTSDMEPSGTGPQVPGVMTRGILDPSTYYYRRLISDAVLALDAARAHPLVDPDRLVVAGISQGGGLTLAAAGLGQAAAAIVEVPFLCHFRRALEITDELPYEEIRRFLRTHRSEEATVFRTLEYVDGRHFAARATIPALFSVGLEDKITPPSTVFAAYNAYAGPKRIRVWPYNGHDAQGADQFVESLAFLTALGLGPGPVEG